MAGDWIKIEVTTPDKPEVHTMAEHLKIDPDAVVGKLIRIWAWFDQHTEGNAVSVSEALLDRIAGTPGFTMAMACAGWIIPWEGKFTLPKFDRHNGETAKTRALTAKRVAKFKRQGNAATNAEVTLPPLPREEKSREDKKERTTPLVAATPLPDWLDKDKWTSYIQLRPAKARKPQSLAAALEKLSRFRAEGHDPNEIVATSLANGWQGLFPPGKGAAGTPDYSSLMEKK